MDLVEREIDALGRLVVPKSWRKQLGKEVILYQIGDEVRMRPKRARRFSELPRIEVSLSSKLNDWHAVERELME